MSWPRDGFGLFLMILVVQNVSFCLCLNEEGLALWRVKDRVVSDPFGALRNWHENGDGVDHCSWFGVECLDGKVVELNLEDLCLQGTLAPEIRNLVHIRSIILRNNCFSGTIPEEIDELKELEFLDLEYNNLSGPLPYKLGNSLSSVVLLLDNNELLTGISSETLELKVVSESQVDANQLCSSTTRLSCIASLISSGGVPNYHTLGRSLLNDNKRHAPQANDHPSPQANDHPPPPAKTPAPSSAPSPVLSSAPSPALSSAPSPAPSSAPSPQPSPSSSPSSLAQPTPPGSSKLSVGAVAGVVGGSIFLVVVIGFFIYRSNKVSTVKPWATGLSGQLQKAFITGVPKLKRPELETACEDFSNVIGSSSIGTIYKGTLSSGVEIAVATVSVKSAKDWSNNLEAQFRQKIETLSKVNHKNFVNLIGYCEAAEPFTRVMVFEYAPNGTLFEHLHIKEAEHLDWAMRLRIAMGMSYCLEHMHQLKPALTHKNLNSSAVTLTEDYAAKISYFNFYNQIAATDVDYPGIEPSSAGPSASPASNVYSFGVILFEMVTGQLPYAAADNSLEDWASDYLQGDRPLKEMVDPTLSSFQEDEVERIGKVIRSCVHPIPRLRPKMREVTTRLRDITGINPDGAVPKISPLWWAELEILSTDGN